MRRPALVGLVTLLAVSCGGSDSSFPERPPTVEVGLHEYGFDYASAFQSGRIVINARNDGQLPHQLVLVYLPPELPPIDQQLRSEERAVVPTVVAMHDRAPGATGSFAVDLDPGRYAFVCFVQDPDGVQHALKGMSSEFRVA
jgi:hypothetical protein